MEQLGLNVDSDTKDVLSADIVTRDAWPWTWPWEGFDLDAVEALNIEQ